jgi:molecular chaperone DnaJ
MTSIQTCNVCGGTGRIIRERCYNCSGTGLVKKNKILEVEIPRGINSDQTIRISGKGEAGKNGGPRGDLLVTVYVKPHKYFVRKDYDLYLDVPIEYAQAVLGDEIEIQTLYGLERIKIKPGTQSGTQLILKNKGVPHVNNNRVFGDLILKLNIAVPTNISEKQRKILLDFSREAQIDSGKKKSFFDKLKETLGKK